MSEYSCWGLTLRGRCVIYSIQIDTVLNYGPDNDTISTSGMKPTIIHMQLTSHILQDRRGYFDHTQYV